MKITTVLGDMEPETLGLTSFHEHVLCHMDLLKIAQIPDSMLTMIPENMAFLRETGSVSSPECRLEDDVDFAAAELDAFRRYVNGQTICEASAIGMRGDIRKLRDASKRSGVNIVCCTGLYLLHTQPSEMQIIEENALVEVFSKEITEGIDDTGIRPGFVKCALGTLNNEKNALHERELLSLKACSRAAAKHGLSLHVHTGGPLTPEVILHAVDTVLECGLDPDKLVMLHMDAWLRPSKDLMRYVSGELSGRTISLDLPMAMLEKGCNIGFDSWGSPFASVLPDDYDRAKGLLALIHAGYEDHITLGHDVINKAFGRTAGYYGYTRFASFLPQIFNPMGINDATLQKLMFHNPARILMHGYIPYHGD